MADRPRWTRIADGTPLVPFIRLINERLERLYEALQPFFAAGPGAGSGAPTTATYITQTADAGLSAEQALSSLATGVVKVTTGTGVLSTAVANTDYAAATHASRHKNGGADELLFHELGEPTASVEFAQQQALQFVVENRTSDPGSPVAGQLWLRTDL